MRKEIKIAGLAKINAISERDGGTVFRGKRVMEVETIVKVLPVSIDLNKKDDPQTVVYLRELKRLKNLNQVPDIHVVKIISTGLTEGDSFPFIETEFVNGPDLEQLLSFPNDAIFRIDAVIDLASQMAAALAHSHRAMVKHGRINSCNIRLSGNTGGYTLLNFGRSLLNDEQRKAQLKNTRAPEYLAPEQLNGQLLFESDIYSLGLVLFHVLTGSLPQQKAVAVSGATEDTVVPVTSIGQQIKELRKETLPVGWTDEEKLREMNIPVWLQNTVAICLQEDPGKRYGSGIKLQEAIKLHAFKEKESNSPVASAIPVKLAEPKEVKETAPVQKIAATTDTKTTDDKDAEIKRLKALIIQKEGQLDVYKYQTADYNPESNKLNVSRPLFFTLIALILALGAFAAYAYFFREPENRQVITTYTDSDTSGSYSNDTSEYMASEAYADSVFKADSAAYVRSMPPIPGTAEEAKASEQEETKKPEVKKPVAKAPASGQSSRTTKTAAKKPPTRMKPEPDQNPDYYEPKEKRSTMARYILATPKAYLYDKPDVRTRRPVYLASSSNSELTASEDTNGFIYVVFFNTERQITKGWLRKVDLRRIN